MRPGVHTFTGFPKLYDTASEVIFSASCSQGCVTALVDWSDALMSTQCIYNISLPPIRMLLLLYTDCDQEVMKTHRSIVILEF